MDDVILDFVQQRLVQGARYCESPLPKEPRPGA
jgi:hypothetical protein